MEGKWLGDSCLLQPCFEGIVNHAALQSLEHDAGRRCKCQDTLCGSSAWSLGYELVDRNPSKVICGHS